MPPRRPEPIRDAELLEAARTASNLRQLLLALGVAAYGGNYEWVRGRLLSLGVDDERFMPRPRARPVRLEDLARAAAVADGWADLARLLGLGDSSSAQRRVKRLAESAGLDCSHFAGQAWSRGTRRSGRASPLSELLVAGRATGTNALKRRLLREGLLPPSCATCGHERWCGRAVPLELDHVDGDRTNNRLENLRLLCPNCHAQTGTYRGRNIGAATGAPRRFRRGETEVEEAQARAVRSEERLVRVLTGAAYGRAAPP